MLPGAALPTTTTQSFLLEFYKGLRVVTGGNIVVATAACGGGCGTRRRRPVLVVIIVLVASAVIGAFGITTAVVTGRGPTRLL